MRRAVILAGTGAIGWATARRLLAADWKVVVTGLDPTHVPSGLVGAGGSFIQSDRNDVAALNSLVGGGADLLVDCGCYTAAHAAALVPLLDGVSSTVMISSKAVYVDACGRHSGSDDPPRFDGPIREDQPTLRPNDADFNSREGYGANKVAAEEVLLASGHPISVLRPSKVHGAWSRRPREWVFVKRVPDNRPVVILARGGAGADQPSAAVNIAALIEVVAGQPGQRILNCADPDCPDGREIARIVADYLGHDWEEVLLDDSPVATELGAHPWDTLPPITLDTTLAEDLGYRAVGNYAHTIADELDGLVGCASDDHTRDRLPADEDPYFAPMFNYQVEDPYLERSGA